MSSSQRYSGRRRQIFFGALVICFLLVLIFLPRQAAQKKPDFNNGQNSEAALSKSGQAQKGFRPFRKNGANLPDEPQPRGKYEYIFDRSPNGGGFLIAKNLSKNFRPDSESAGGYDLWIQDANGTERLVAENVFRARFSPDGSKIAYGTAEAEIHVETLNGDRLQKIERAFEPTWKADGSSLTYTSVPEGRPLQYPEVLQLTTIDLGNGQVKHLTDGQWDDVRPNFDPSGDWVLFVSGARSGLASFWKVSADGGPPVQITNLGMEQVNPLFVPTPYDRTLWTRDNRWFVYDFKNGSVEQTWGLEFDERGNFKGALKIGDGIDPRLSADGQKIIAVKHTDISSEAVEYPLPQTAPVMKQ